MNRRIRPGAELAMLHAHEQHETHAAAKKIFSRLLSERGGGGAPSVSVWEDYAELADIYYKKGERHQAINILREFQTWFLDTDDVFLANKILNKLEFLNGKDYVESKPLKLEISLTDRCNLQCLMCLQRTRGCREISEETYREIIGMMPYLEVINWIGGEPFVSPRLAPLFDEASRYPRLRQNIITNALLIDESWAEKLAASRTFLLLSIDGFKKETYEYVRKGARFADLLASLEYIKKAFAAHQVPGLPERLAINFVLMRHNMQDLEYIVDFAYRFKISSIRVSTLFPFQPDEIYREQNIESDPKLVRWFLDVAQPRLLCEAALKNVRVGQLPIFSRQAAEQATPGKPETASGAQLGNTFLTCPYPWGSLSSDAEGFARPLCQCGPGICAGNVYKQPIADIWNSPGLRRYRQLADTNDVSRLACAKCDMFKYRFQMKLFDPLW